MHRLARVALIAAAILFVGTSSAFAQIIGGSIDSVDPMMPVVFISTPNCTGQGVFPVHYEAHPFTVTSGGNYNISLTSTGDFASFYIYQTAFDPANGLTNCIAGANSGTPKQVNLALAPGTQYFAVPFNDAFAQPDIQFTMVFAGPAPVVFATVPVLPIWMYPGLFVGLGAMGRRMLVRRRHTADPELV